MPDLLPGDVAVATTNIELVDSDVAADAATTPELLSTDEAEEPETGCDCCNHCPLPTLCSGWAPDWTSVTIGGVSDVTTDPDDSTNCAYCYAAGGIAACYNKTIAMQLLSPVTGGGPGSHPDNCNWMWYATCVDDVLIALADGSVPYRLTNWAVLISADPDGLSDLILVYLFVAGFLDPGQTTNGIAYVCGSSLAYVGSFTVDTFPCAGPWTLTLLTQTGCITGAPATVDVTPSSSGSLPAADCCHSTTTPPAATYNCVDGQCVDPGGGTGVYASLAACLAHCPAVCVTPPCGSGTNGGVDGGPVSGLDGCCARDESVDDTLHYAIVSAGGTACFESTGTIVWSEGFGVWIGNTISCGAFITIAVFCFGETWCARIWINGTLAFSQDGNYATDTGNCSPLSLTWSVDLTGVPAAVAIGVTGVFDFHVFES